MPFNRDDRIEALRYGYAYGTKSFVKSCKDVIKINCIT